MKIQNILITGGCGLIGSFLVDYIIKNTSNVKLYILDNMSRGKLEYLQSLPNDRIELLKCDIMECEKYRDIINKCSVVYHAASKVLGIGYSVKNHYDMLIYNDRMTNSLLDCLLESSNLEHFVVISSSCIYDDDMPNTVKEEEGFIGIPEKANLGYGMAKRYLEGKAGIFAKEKDVKLTIFRPFNVYGECYTWAGENSQGLPSLVKKVLDNDGKIEIWGSGSQRRNYMHAYDCARIIADVTEKRENIASQSEVYNVGIMDTTSLKDLALKMCAVYNIEPKFTFLTDMPEGRLVKSADMTKLNNIIPNYDKSLITLEKGLALMKHWYLSNFTNE